jgi:hypothetical protein
MPGMPNSLGPWGMDRTKSDWGSGGAGPVGYSTQDQKTKLPSGGAPDTH